MNVRLFKTNLIWKQSGIPILATFIKLNYYKKSILKRVLKFYTKQKVTVTELADENSKIR